MPNSENALTDEDRAALKYAHYLKSYDQREDGGNQDLSAEERDVRKQVRKIKTFTQRSLHLHLFC